MQVKKEELEPYTKNWLVDQLSQLVVETSEIVCYSHLFKSFPQFVMTHTVKDIRVINEREVDIFLEFPCFLYDSANVGDLNSASSKPSLNTWEFLVHVLLKPSLKDLGHTLTSVGGECNCLRVWTFFSSALLRNWDNDWPFPVLWPLLGFPNLLTYWCSTIIASSFRIFF